MKPVLKEPLGGIRIVPRGLAVGGKGAGTPGGSIGLLGVICRLNPDRPPPGRFTAIRPSVGKRPATGGPGGKQWLGGKAIRRLQCRCRLRKLAIVASSALPPTDPLAQRPSYAEGAASTTLGPAGRSESTITVGNMATGGAAGSGGFAGLALAAASTIREPSRFDALRHLSPTRPTSGKTALAASLARLSRRKLGPNALQRRKTGQCGLTAATRAQAGSAFSDLSRSCHRIQRAPVPQRIDVRTLHWKPALDASPSSIRLGAVVFRAMAPTPHQVPL